MLVVAEDAVELRLAPPKSTFKVWDTQYVAPSKAFSVYREAICEAYMQWSPEVDSDSEFHARVETTNIGDGSITRHRGTPHYSTRGHVEISSSPRESSYLVLVMGGNSECEQRGRTAFMRPGDILVFDSSEPAKFTMGPGSVDLLVVTIPKNQIVGARDCEDQLSNVVLNQNRTPLAKCLSVISERMIGASEEELTALYGAAVSLLPVEAGCFHDERKDTETGKKGHYLLRDILNYIDQNIACAELTPQEVARQFGISVRYVHKLFIGSGATFCSHMTGRRLEYISKDLVSPEYRRQPISLVAFRWGFNDLSSFNRAFKSRYSCTPSQFRMRFGR